MIKKVLDWIKNNKILFLVLLIAVLIRIYYFIITYGQAIWWDEAEYLLKARNIAFGTSAVGWYEARPILFPLIAAGVMKIGLGESFLRILILISSIFLVYFTYLLSKHFFDENVALVSTFLMSIFYLGLFYTYRLLSDIPSITLALVGLYFFFNNKNSFKRVILGGVILGLATLIRYSPVLLFGSVILYYLIIQNKEILKNRYLRYFSFSYVLTILPFVIYLFLKGTFFYTFSGSTSAIRDKLSFSQLYQIFMQYVNFTPNYFASVLFVVFLIGFVFILFDVIIGFDLILKRKSNHNFGLFIIVVFVCNYLFFGFLLNHFEDRYLFNIFPFSFMVVGFILVKLLNLVPKLFSSSFANPRIKKNLAVFLILVILFLGTYQQIKQADPLIKSKSLSFLQQKQAALWMKENSNPNDLIVTPGVPQYNYYSQIRVAGYRDEEKEFFEYLDRERPRFIALSVFEKSPSWSYSLPERYPDLFKPVFVSFLDSNQKQPAEFIFLVDYS